MTFYRESEYAYHVPEERAELFHCYDSGSTEHEYLELLHALVLVSKPLNILETGTYLGFGTMAITEAIKFNGVGHLTTIDLSEENVSKVAASLQSLGMDSLVTVLKGDSLCLIREAAEPYDFVFLDSELFIRGLELELLFARNLLPSGSMIVVHDTSRLRVAPNGVPDVGSKIFWETFEKYSNRVRYLEFPLSRGMTVAQVL